MLIHAGSTTTMKTLCGKPVARRWWVESRRWEHGRIGNLSVFREVKASCHACQKRMP